MCENTFLPLGLYNLYSRLPLNILGFWATILFLFRISDLKISVHLFLQNTQFFRWGLRPQTTVKHFCPTYCTILAAKMYFYTLYRIYSMRNDNNVQIF